MARAWDRRYGWHPTAEEREKILERGFKKLEKLIQKTLKKAKIQEDKNSG